MEKSLITVSLVGLPNAGKSTLINKIVGQKISIISPKSQTTRFNIIGIKNVDKCQIIFTDTPGFKNSKNALEKQMKNFALEAIESSDITCVVIDSCRLCKYGLDKSHLPNGIQGSIFLLNKIDKIRDKRVLLPHMKNIGDIYNPLDIFLLSATKSTGIDSFTARLCELSNNNPWMFENDEVTDISQKELAQEITREKLLYRIQDEIPYSVQITTERWEEQGDDLYINQTIFVNKNSHKAIVIGSGAANIKKIGQDSRAEISKLLDKKVRLFLYVKVLEDTDL
ncbi:GTPase Era [Candidatus Cyrtobacter comes]|uniref:GTPase Era n=1 Tax=Candidatus Cyrtobacter comes TaxID=675776 RepID=A0ABU5L8X7_9RICK|nr:GTPase Era [Candidatus Cyrtobacter comes]MDZ5762340.1 GTPase Era [Candidatus Cyrtobacter comes]